MRHFPSSQFKDFNSDSHLVLYGYDMLRGSNIKSMYINILYGYNRSRVFYTKSV